MNAKTPGPVLIELNDTAFAYDGMVTQHEFSIRKGEYVSILGENGSGKLPAQRIAADERTLLG